MRSKLPKRCWLSLALGIFGASNAFAATATPFAPYSIVSYGGENTVYYADTASVAGFYLDNGNGFAEINFDSTSAELFFTISGFSSTNRYLYVFSEGTSSSSYYSVPLASCDSGACTNQYQYDTGGSVTQANIGIAPKAICDATIGGSASAKGCTGASVDRTTLPFPGLRLRFVVSSATTVGAVTATEKSGAPLLQIFPEQAGPRLTNCPATPGFFPGDGSILVDTSALIAVPDTTAGGSSNTFTHVFVAAQKAGALPADYTTATLLQRIDYQVGSVEVTPIENSTDAGGSPSIPYAVDYAVEDSAGVYAFCGQLPTGSTAPVSAGVTYPLSNVFATDIQGFLRESNCFVATASFRDGRAPGVMLLRHFRDEVLSNFDLGQKFIGWYYRNGPIAADWLIAHPIFRSLSLMALLPLQGAAWIALHPAVLLFPVFALIVLLGSLGLTPGIFGLLLLGMFVTAPKALATDQPYIDSLISELPRETTRTNENPDPYIQSLKSRLGKEDDSTGYTEEMKKQIAPRDGSDGYTDRIQKTLPKTTGSAIEDYKKGKHLHPNKGDLDTRSAFGFNFMAAATRTYTAGANQDIAYESVYGDGWVPDFTVHYEWRPFTGDFIRKFGLYTSVGASFTKANGVLNYQDSRFGSTSRTEFKFIVLPVNAGLIYRFSLADFIWPYFGAGPSAIGFIESRNDKQSSHHGYGLGYWFMGGVAFGLDWISPKASWDQYESTGVKHTYFSIDYSYLESLGGGLVEFTVDGVKAGFTFEI